MNKKLLALTLAAAMGLSLTACGGGNTTPSATPTESQTAAPAESPAAESDLSYIKDNGKLKIGFTYFSPMNYIDDNGDFVGFETEFATAVCEKLGVEPDFQEINWDSKIMELDSKRIDCIWNGMTITPALSEALSIGDPYVKNYQVVVIRAADADKYKTTADLIGARVEAEAGSAGEATVTGEEADPNLAQATYTSVNKQVDALLEVKAGGADACVLDFVLANAMVGQGDYSDLMVIPDLQLSVEEYGVGFRKGSDIVPAFNEAMQALIDDGTLNTIAEQYDLDDLLLVNQ